MSARGGLRVITELKKEGAFRGEKPKSWNPIAGRPALVSPRKIPCFELPWTTRTLHLPVVGRAIASDAAHKL